MLPNNKSSHRVFFTILSKLFRPVWVQIYWSPLILGESSFFQRETSIFVPQHTLINFSRPVKSILYIIICTLYKYIQPSLPYCQLKKLSINFFVLRQGKIPSGMEVALRYKLLTLLTLLTGRTLLVYTWFTLLTWFTL